MALLAMCMAHGISVIVAHVNYHQRAQAEQEEEYVKAFCAKHNILCLVKNEPFTYTGNFEASARDYRYAFFEEIVKAYQCDGILTAHHQDDLLETYLMQKEKGIVPSVYGIAASSYYHGIPLYRPLLSYTKKELEEYCQQNQITYYIDETNAQDIHTRNVIRNHTLKEMNAHERMKLLQEIETKNAALTALRQEAETYITDGKVNIAQYRTCRLEVRCCILRTILPMHGIGEKFIQQIDTTIQKQNDFAIAVKGKYLAQRDGWFFLCEKPKSYAYVLHHVEIIANDVFAVETTGRSVDGAYVKEEDFPLTIRNVQPGDAIEMRYGTKKLNRFFIDRHIARIDRMDYPVVVNCAGKVILVPGLGCDKDHYAPQYNLYVRILKR